MEQATTACEDAPASVVMARVDVTTQNCKSLETTDVGGVVLMTRQLEVAICVAAAHGAQAVELLVAVNDPTGQGTG